MLLLGYSLWAASAVATASADDNLKAVKDLYLKEFEAIDTDKDGKISREEYLNHQFNSLRANIIESEGFVLDENTAEESDQTSDKPVSAEISHENIVGVPSALSDMANYKLEEDDGIKEETVRLTKEDVMPESKAEDPIEELDLSISEEENLRQLIEGTETKPADEEITAKTEEVSEKQALPIQLMLDTIKKTLPKKIDEITTWVDIKYANDVIDYIYKAEIETSAYSEDEVKLLKENIQNEACTKAYSDMCPKIKPMFIDKGIDMRIIYLDKADEQISACEFNKTTCKD